MPPLTLVAHLHLVIDYLNGKTDIYNGDYEDTVVAWDNVWLEMQFKGYNPEKPEGIRAYIAEQL